ncbi:unnamed protein product, partial [Acanthoscelides obtectus]
RQIWFSLYTHIRKIIGYKLIAVRNVKNHILIISMHFCQSNVESGN